MWLYQLSLLGFTLLVTAGCTEDGSNFSELEEKAALSQGADAAIEISKWSPEEDPVVISEESSTTFTVQLSSGVAANAKFTFYLDDVEIHSGDEAFYTLSGSSVSAGTHILKVEAQNSSSSDKHEFNLRKNILPSVTGSSPAQTGNSMECGGVDVIKFVVAAEDLDNDPLTFTWLVNNTENDDVFSVTSSKTFSEAQFFPPCNIAGTANISVRISDGIGQITQSWSVDVINQGAIGPVSIINWSPSDNPVVVSDGVNTTFAVQIDSGAGPDVNYRFLLNNVTELANSSAAFYVLNGTTVAAGLHTLKVIASNSISTDSKVFNIRKNALPTIVNSSPTPTGNSVTCGSGFIDFSVEAADANSDAMTFSWEVNGAAMPAVFSITTTATTSAARFSPTCAIFGAVTIGVKINDGYGVTTKTWVADVLNPTVANILDLFPSANPVLITSTGSQVFSVSATGLPPLSYVWKLDDAAIPGATTSSLTLNGSSLSPGDISLTVEVSDVGSSDTRTVTVHRNGPPVISSPSPSSASFRMNYKALANFNITATDPNPGDTLSYIWTLDGLPNAALSGSGNSAVLVASASLVGQHTVAVSVSDTHEESTRSWVVDINYFSTECNNLIQGRVCTYVGAGLGSGSKPEEENERIRIQPTAVIDDGSDNWFIADDGMAVVWFYNRSAFPVSRVGLTIPAKTAVVVAGSGVTGAGASGTAADEFHINRSFGLGYDSARDLLYFSDYANHRVVRVGSDRIAYVVLGTGAATNNAATNSQGIIGYNHSCLNPVQMVIDSTADELFVACYGNHSIKKITNASSSNLDNILAYTAVGKHASNIPAAGSTDGSVGFNGDANTNGPWGMTSDPDGNIYFTEYLGCRIRIWNRTSDVKNFFSPVLSAPAGQVKTLFGDGTCNTVNGAYTSLRFHQPESVAVLMDGADDEPLGFFVTTSAHNRVSFVNNSNGTLTFGGIPVLQNQGQVVLGTGTAAYNGDLLGTTTNISRPSGMLISSNKESLIVPERTTNFRIRSLDISINNGAVTSKLGSGYLGRGYTGDTETPTMETILDQPGYATVLGDYLYFTDRNNNRIRRISMTTGLVERVVGNGSGAASDGPANLVLTEGPADVVKHGDVLLFVDNRGAAGANRTCQVRAYNPTGVTKTIFGKSVGAGMVATVAGNYALGCAAWDVNNYEGAVATNVALYLAESIASNGTELYIANYSSHCILKLAADGTITTAVGLCGTTGTTDNVDFLNARLRYPFGISMDPLYPTNFFFIDRPDQATSVLKYANFFNTSVTIAGTAVAPGTIREVLSMTGTARPSYVAAFQNQVCISSGLYNNPIAGNHNVVCRDRTGEFDWTTTLIVGAPPSSTVKAGGIRGVEQENKPGIDVRMYAPTGLIFDDEGNLYIMERSGHAIRKVRKWW